MKIALKILKWVVISVVTITVLLISLYFIITTSKVVTSLVHSYAPDYLNAKIEVGRVELNVLSSWPNVELSIGNTTIISKAYGTQSSDTLLRFASLQASLNIKSLLDSSLIDLTEARLTNAHISATVNKQGKGSWEIYSSDTTQNDTTSSSYTFRIGTIKMEGDNQVTFKDELRATEINGAISQIEITQLNPNTYATSLNIALKQFRVDTIDLEPLLPITLKGSTDINLSTFALNNTALTAEVAGATAQIHGEAQLKDSSIVSSLKIDFTNVELDKSIDLLSGYIDSEKIKNAETNLRFDIEIAASGELDYKNIPTGKLPTISLAVKSNGGGIKFSKRSESIDKFAIDLKAHFNIEDNSKNYIDLRELKIESQWLNLYATAMIKRYLETSRIDINTHIKTSVDLRVSNNFTSKIAQNISNFGNLQCSGKLSLDMKVRANAANLSLAKIGFNAIDSKFTFNNVQITSDSLNTYLDGHISATTKNKTLLLHSELDSLDLNISALKLAANGQDIVIDAGITARGKAYAQSNEIPPLGGKIRAHRLNFTEFASADTLKFRLRNSFIRFEVASDPTDSTKPIFNLELNSNRLVYIIGLNRFKLGKSDIDITARLMTTSAQAAAQLAALRERQLNALQLRHPNIGRDSLLTLRKNLKPNKKLTAQNSNYNIDLNPGKDIRSLLRRWTIQGHIGSNKAQITTPYFPLKTKISKVDINFNMDTLKINSLQGVAGKSDLSLSGEVTNIKNSLLGRAPLSIDIALKSNLLNFNELIIAVNSGEQTASKLENIAFDQHSDEQYEEIVSLATDTTNASMLVMIPPNININASMLINKAYYGELELSELTTKARSRQSILQLSELRASTNIGKLKLHALYATPSIDSIYADAEIELEDVDLKKLIGQIPQIDTLLPMLASFEGMVTLKAALHTKLDSTMTIVMPSLKAVASISGRDLVLLDGEAFTEISKMLKFKNKDRNLIDKISAELKIENTRVELFPCLIEIDRYKAAASGTHSLDMTFKYHISVLKSIIPFRFGVNIFGNLDDWKFRVVSAKYKNEKSIASNSYEIENFRINLRDEIENIFKTENQSIIKGWDKLDLLTPDNLTKRRTSDSTDDAAVWESTKIVLTKDGYKTAEAQ